MEILDEIKKDKNDFLKNKLDLIKQFFTTLLVVDVGLFGFLFLNFEKNSWFLNFCAVCGIILVGAVFGFLLKMAIEILKEMKGLLE